MAMQQRAAALPVESITGTVTAVNPKGLRLEGQDGWLNYSQYHDVPRPNRGQSVQVQVTRSERGSYIKALVLLDTGTHCVESVESSASTASRSAGSRETTITRLAVLKAASHFLTNTGATGEDVLDLAAAWEGWVTR